MSMRHDSELVQYFCRLSMLELESNKSAWQHEQYLSIVTAVWYANSSRMSHDKNETVNLGWV